MLFASSSDDDFALGINRLGHLVALLRRCGRIAPVSSLDVLIRMGIAVPQHHMVPRHLALFLPSFFFGSATIVGA